MDFKLSHEFGDCPYITAAHPAAANIARKIRFMNQPPGTFQRSAFSRASISRELTDFG
jgi:hypothetical protein